MAKAKIIVFHVLTDKNIGGAGRWLLNYLRYYNREKFAVTVVLPKGSLLIPEVKKLDVPVFAIGRMKDTSFDMGALSALKSLFVDEKPDIVHTHASLTARVAAKLAKVPFIVVTKHCMEGAKGSVYKQQSRRIISYFFSHKIIGVSEAVTNSMVKGGVNVKRVATIYNGIRPLSPITKEERAEVLQKFGGDPEKLAVGIVARLEKVKDHDTFLRSAKRVLAKRNDVCFYVIGDGSLAKSLQMRAKKLGIAENVIFTGFVGDVERVEAALDLNVITSKEEALCLSIIETMSIGIPAVGTDAGGIKEVIQDGKNGYLVPVGDDKALAEKINMALNADKEAFGKYAKYWVERNFLAKYMTSEIERLYLEGER